jgi:hypothetical protein
MNLEKDPSTNLTIEQCEELVTALLEDTAILPPGPKKDELLQLAQGYRNLAKMKRLVLSKVN